MKEKCLKLLQFLRTRKWLTGGLILVLIITAVFAGRLNREKVPVDEFPQTVMPTCRVDRGDVKMVVYATGNIEEVLREEINIASDAKVLSVNVEKGQEVKAGDLLFVLDDSQAALNYAREKLAYDKLKRELDEELKNLKTPYIYSPEAGLITQLSVINGSVVQKDTVVARVARTDYFELKGFFNSVDINQFKVGDKVEVFIQDFLNYFPATVVKVDSKGQGTIEGGILYGVTVQITNPGGLSQSNKGYINKGGTRSIGLEPLKMPDDIEIKAGKMGKVRDIHVSQGDHVAKNDLIITLDSEEQQYILKEKQLELQLAELSYQKSLEELEKSQVKASIDGVVTELNVIVGTNPGNNQPAVTISNTSDLKMKVKVLEEDIHYVELGQVADVYVNAYGEQRFSGTVTKIAQRGILEGSSVFFEVEISLEEPGPLKSGMAGDADIVVLYKENVLRLPPGALTIENDGIATVMVKDADGNPEPRTIRIGAEGVEHIEIIEGLNEGDEVLLLGGQMNPGMHQVIKY
ncbi:MAG: HlyD family efflux transporter periplasmic adaptor subunit [Syntrophomonadaceae bacterium]|nr:HlyD family efflux transporter periplasmic adaptor subunit [Syntrophomonadaceae bacterium]